MGGVVSKGTDQNQVGTGKDFVGSLPTDTSWYYPITNFFLNIICTVNYWNYFQGCGPFNLSGCDDLAANTGVMEYQTYNAQGKSGAIATGSYLKAAWILIDAFLLLVVIALGTVLGPVFSDLLFIPQFLYDLFSLLEGLATPILSLFESGANYILQFLGFTGSIAGQSLFGLASDLVTSLAATSGVPSFVFYVLFGELAVEVLLKLSEDIKNNSGSESCVFHDIYYVLDYPLYWLASVIFPTGIVHDLLSLLFLPPRIFLYLFSDIVSAIYCHYAQSRGCDTIYQPGDCQRSNQI